MHRPSLSQEEAMPEREARLRSRRGTREILMSCLSHSIHPLYPLYHPHRNRPRLKATNHTVKAPSFSGDDSCVASVSCLGKDRDCDGMEERKRGHNREGMSIYLSSERPALACHLVIEGKEKAPREDGRGGGVGVQPISD